MSPRRRVLAITLDLVLVPVLVLAAAGCGGADKVRADTVPGTVSPAASSAAARVLVNVDADGVALAGHDPIAYVADAAPALGLADHASRHEGATYRFTSAEHQSTFEGDRARHAPRFGGYCAYAASQNRLSPGDPQVWQLIDGRLVLFTNPAFRDLFNQDAAGSLRRADQHWPGLVAQHGSPVAP